MTECEPCSVRIYTRSDKVEMRRNFVPTGLQSDETRRLAVQRLTVLDNQVLNYISNEDQGNVELHTNAHDVQTLMQRGKLLAQKINDDLSVNDVPVLSKVALSFVERLWLESALCLINRDDLSNVLRSFLDACDGKVQKYLEEREQDHRLTRLQEVKNRVIHPITGALAVK